MPFEPKLIEFLRDTVAKELPRFADAKLEYYGFTIIMQAIEVVGSIFDGKAASDYGMCEVRFQKGYEYLFPNPPYKGLWQSFFKELRGPVVHQMRPVFDYTLTCARRSTLEDHFTKDQKLQTILVFECLVQDFTEGLDRMINDLQNDQLKGIADESNLTGRYLETFDANNLRTDSGPGPLSAQP